MVTKKPFVDKWGKRPPKGSATIVEDHGERKIIGYAGWAYTLIVPKRYAVRGRQLDATDAELEHMKHYYFEHWKGLRDMYPERDYASRMSETQEQE